VKLALAPENEGLDARDRDRAASLADEGGAAGAILERQESRPPRTPPSPIAVAFAAAAGVFTAIVAWRLLEEVTMKSAYMPTPKPRPDPPQAPGTKPERPREDDGWRHVAVFDDDCATPARPRPVPAELEGER